MRIGRKKEKNADNEDWYTEGDRAGRRSPVWETTCQSYNIIHQYTYQYISIKHGKNCECCPVSQLIVR